jgi:pyruvate/2-oxoglutarate dehydrogenase complex dihydrolipoamide acyltransferase (E2) component
VPDRVPVRVPKLSLAISEANLVEWLVDDGAAVTEGQPLYVVETDKVETEVPAAATGVLRRGGAAGETYPVGTEIGTIEVGID